MGHEGIPGQLSLTVSQAGDPSNSLSWPVKWDSQTRIILKSLVVIFIEITRPFNSGGVIFLSYPLHLLIELVISVST